MKVSSPLTALQLSQADKQENHLKPKLIFFFLPFFQASEEEDLKYPVTFRDGVCHEAEQRWSGMKHIQRELISFQRKENTPFPTLDSSKLRKNQFFIISYAY